MTNDAEVEIELSGAFVTWNAEELTAKRNEGLERDPRSMWIGWLARILTKRSWQSKFSSYIDFILPFLICSTFEKPLRSRYFCILIHYPFVLSLDYCSILKLLLITITCL